MKIKKLKKRPQHCPGWQTINGVPYGCFQKATIVINGKRYCPIHAAEVKRKRDKL